MRQYHHRQLPAKHHGFDRALTIFFVFAERLVLALCAQLLRVLSSQLKTGAGT